jgi:DnaJ-class molecular chaperone
MFNVCFQRICAQVLSDESLRASYDANGKAGVEAAPKVG